MKWLNWFKKGKVFNALIKWGIGVLLMYTLYKQLIDHEEAGNMSQLINGLHKELFWKYLSVLVFLNIGNWSIEAFRWKLLMLKLEPISFRRAFIAVLSGITLGLMTPNRIGDFVGKILFIKKANKIRAVLLTLVGSFSMTIAAIFMGMISFAYLQYQYTIVEEPIFYLVEIFILLLFVFALWNYYNIAIMSKYLFRLKWLKRFYSYRSTALLLTPFGLLSYLLLSFLRYSILITQYLLILNLLGVEYTIIDAVFAVAMIYFVQTVVPTPALIELGVRGHAAIAIIGLITTSNTINIVTAAYGLWLINVTVPAIVGGIILMNYDFKKVLKFK